MAILVLAAAAAQIGGVSLIRKPTGLAAVASMRNTRGPCPSTHTIRPSRPAAMAARPVGVIGTPVGASSSATSGERR